jgi:hypothetical protein
MRGPRSKRKETWKQSFGASYGNGDGKPRYSYKVYAETKLTPVLCKTKREARQLVEYLDVKGIDATITPVNRDNIHLN